MCARVPVQVEDICQVRMIILALPEVPRFMPTTIRVHLVPELPNQVAELMALESAECTSGSALDPSAFGSSTSLPVAPCCVANPKRC